MLYEPRNNVMLDLETAGPTPGCAILVIAAVTFDLNETFYAKINYNSSMKMGFTSSLDTMLWWDQQDPETKIEAFSGFYDIIHTLNAFTDWLHIKCPDALVWGNGADFDQPMIAWAYHHLKMKFPYSHRNNRCFRTLKNMNFGVVEPEFMGSKHHALSDAVHQAIWANEILLKLQELDKDEQA